jgi:hypothetical protein
VIDITVLLHEKHEFRISDVMTDKEGIFYLWFVRY